MLKDILQEKLDKRKKKWWEWHKKNPQVWDKFEKYTLEAINSGRKKYSHWAIINRIRWHNEIETKGGDFKISNDYICFYARLFHARHPQYKDFFTLKAPMFWGYFIYLPKLEFGFQQADKFVEIFSHIGKVIN